MALFYIGLSYLSNAGAACAYTIEGRRILSLLDAGAMKAAGRRQGEIAVEAGGRPYYRDGRADFNISHSGGRSGGMVAVSYLPAAFRTGCDVQYMAPRPAKGAIAGHFFHAPEQAYIAAASGEDERIRRFYRLWTLKEAGIKLRGLSITAIRESPLFTLEGETGEYACPGGLQPYPGNLVFFLYEAGDDERYSLAVCRETAEIPAEPPMEIPADAPPEIRWFSPEPLPLRRIAVLKAADRSC